MNRNYQLKWVQHFMINRISSLCAYSMACLDFSLPPLDAVFPTSFSNPPCARTPSQKTMQLLYLKHIQQGMTVSNAMQWTNIKKKQKKTKTKKNKNKNKTKKKKKQKQKQKQKKKKNKKTKKQKNKTSKPKQNTLILFLFFYLFNYYLFIFWQLNSKEALLEVSESKKVTLPSLEKLNWRVDVTISTTAQSRVFKPSILMRTTLSDGSIRTFECSVDDFHKMRYAVAKVLKGVNDLESHPMVARELE